MGSTVRVKVILAPTSQTSTVWHCNLCFHINATRLCVDQVGNLIEKLIDAGRPVMMGLDGHNTVIVGYNKTRLLCAGSWSDEMIRDYRGKKNSAQSFVARLQGKAMQPLDNMYDNFHEMGQMDVYMSGFHHQNKNMVFSSVRDLLYFE